MFAKITNSGETVGDRVLLKAAKKAGFLTGGDGLPTSPIREKLLRKYGVVPMDIMDLAHPDPSDIHRAIVRTSNAAQATAVVLVTRTQESESARALSTYICNGAPLAPYGWGISAETCLNGRAPFLIVYEDQIMGERIPDVISSFLFSRGVGTVFITASEDLQSPNNLTPIMARLSKTWKAAKTPRSANRALKSYK